MIHDKILDYFLSEYEGSSFVTRQKVSLLVWTHIVLLPIAVLYLVINLLRDYPPELSGIYTIDIFFIISIIAGLIFIKKGKFTLAVSVDIGVFTLLTIGGHFVKLADQINTGFNDFAVLMYGVMVFTALFSDRRLQRFVFLVFMILTLSFHFYSQSLVLPSVCFSLLSGTLNNIIVIIAVFTLSYHNSAITERALSLAQHELDINAELNRSLEQKVRERTEKIQEEREVLDFKNRELEEIKNTLLLKNNELETARINAEDANLAKNRFLATLSHELRTPLNGIIGISSLMLEKKLSDEDIYTLQMIKQSGENLFFIIQDLLDFTIIENNQITIKKSFFNIDDLVNHIVAGLADQIKNKDLHLIKKVNSERAVVFSDKTRITQIILNLLTNSIKYTLNGSIDLTVAADDKLTISVRDTGIGIERNKINSIFEAFTRIESDYVRSQSGLGLGLPIVSQIVSMMNGSINVESEPGSGSTFTVIIPLDEAVEDKDEIESAESLDYSIIRDKRILIVDDNAINRFYFMSILKKAGAAVDEALNGKEALFHADSVRYDVILMDLNMPDFDGFLLTQIIRSSHNPNNRTLIAALSAHAYRDHIKMCREAGMDDFIAKPVEREYFLSMICSLLKSKNRDLETD